MAQGQVCRLRGNPTGEARTKTWRCTKPPHWPGPLGIHSTHTPPPSTPSVDQHRFPPLQHLLPNFPSPGLFNGSHPYRKLSGARSSQGPELQDLSMQPRQRVVSVAGRQKRASRPGHCPEHHPVPRRCWVPPGQQSVSPVERVLPVPTRLIPGSPDDKLTQH